MEEYKIVSIFQNALPPISDEERQNLRKSIEQYGYKGAPILLWHNTIVDGHNRYQICKELGIEWPVERLDFATETEVLLWIMRNQLARRNLNKAQKIQTALRFEHELQEEAKKRQIEAGRKYGRGNTRTDKQESEEIDQPEKKQSEDSEKPKKQDIDEIAEEETEKVIPTWAEDIPQSGTVNSQMAVLAGVSEETFRKGRKVLKEGPEQLKKEMLSGEKSINAAYNELREKMPTSSEKVVYPPQFEIKYGLEGAQESYKSYIENMSKLLEYDFTDSGGANRTDEIHSEITDLIEMLKELHDKLSGADEMNGFIKMAS